MVKTVEHDDENDLTRMEKAKNIPPKHHGSSSSSSSSSCSPSSVLLLSAKRFMVFFAVFLLGAVVYSRWISTYVEGNGLQPPWRKSYYRCITNSSCKEGTPGSLVPQVTCPEAAGACGSLAHAQPVQIEDRSSTTDPPVRPWCPEYFLWIHEDLKAWKETGITREMVEMAQKYASFRLVVVGGRVYVKQYSKCFQTRDVFTQWGVLQLLKLHRGKLPDLDLMFDCNDTPRIRAHDYAPLKEGAPPPPPLFHYCGDNATVEIVFPDWSFWGWPEINIKPWEALRKDLKEGNRRIRWLDREPYAFWKGNQWVSPSRSNLLRCNASNDHDWNARLFTQDWTKESRQGFSESNLASQCTYRYKIYIEGKTWSVSEKYILACDSPTLMVKPKYFDFFSRGLIPLQHYWPININHMCSSIQFAVNWGNNHTYKAQRIGKEGSGFIEEQLSMGYVYDYMFHVLNEYSKLLTYKPTMPAGAVEMCEESMFCSTRGRARDFMLDSMVYHTSPPIIGPSCTLPPPLDPYEMEMLLHAKATSIEQLEAWEKRAQTEV